MDLAFRAEIDGEKMMVIIDYKIAELAKNSLGEPEALEVFLDRMKETYAPQLSRYSKLMREIMVEEGEAGLKIKTGLFFPLQDILVWV